MDWDSRTAVAISESGEIHQKPGLCRRAYARSCCLREARYRGRVRACLHRPTRRCWTGFVPSLRPSAAGTGCAIWRFSGRFRAESSRRTAISTCWRHWRTRPPCLPMSFLQWRGKPRSCSVVRLILCCATGSRPRRIAGLASTFRPRRSRSVEIEAKVSFGRNKAEAFDRGFHE
jgi:hypothetical protein